MAKYEEAIGQNIDRLLRGSMTQAELGRRMGTYVGEWSRQAVSAATKGKRVFTAAELVALATVLGVTVPDLLRSSEPVTMPSNRKMSPTQIDGVLRSTDDRQAQSVAWQRLEEAAETKLAQRNATKRLEHLLTLIRPAAAESPEFRLRVQTSRDEVMRRAQQEMDASDAQDRADGYEGPITWPRDVLPAWVLVCDELLQEGNDDE